MVTASGFNSGGFSGLVVRILTRMVATYKGSRMSGDTSAFVTASSRRKYKFLIGQALSLPPLQCISNYFGDLHR